MSTPLVRDGAGTVAAWGCGSDRARAMCSSILARRSGAYGVVRCIQDGSAGEAAPVWRSEGDLCSTMACTGSNGTLVVGRGRGGSCGAADFAASSDGPDDGAPWRNRTPLS